MACDACNAKFRLFTRKKQCMDCKRYFCSKCVVERSSKMMSCDSCNMLSQRPLTLSIIVQMRSKDLRQYLLAKKVSIIGCIEKEDLVKRLISFANGTNDYYNAGFPCSSFTTQPAAETCQRDADVLNQSPLQLCMINALSDLDCLSVKQLKKLLTANRVDYKGCIEKRELLNKARMLWKEYKQSRTEIEISDENLCKICKDEPLECVILECGHIACCLNCGKHMSECPICKQYVVRVVRFFKA